MSKTAIGSYKGKPTITLAPDSRFPFTFGIAKAQLIVENFEAIKAFADSHGATTGEFSNRVLAESNLK